MSHSKINLLIVDDDPALRTSLSHIFTSQGHTVRLAEDGFAALDKIRQQVPDIILSDLNMPGMSGFELLSVIRRRFPNIQAIAMSGAFSGEGLQLGVAADAFYEKGTGIQNLLLIINDMTHPEFHPSLRSSGKLAPIWIHRNGHNHAGKAYVMITCPECLRISPQILPESTALIQETGCIYCASLIHYAILQPTNPAFPQAFQHKPTALPLASLRISETN